MEEEKTCEWVQDANENDRCYACNGNSFLLEVGTPKDNEIIYCCFCGRKIKEWKMNLTKEKARITVELSAEYEFTEDRLNSIKIEILEQSIKEKLLDQLCQTIDEATTQEEEDLYEIRKDCFVDINIIKKLNKKTKKN